MKIALATAPARSAAPDPETSRQSRADAAARRRDAHIVEEPDDIAVPAESKTCNACGGTIHRELPAEPSVLDALPLNRIARILARPGVEGSDRTFGNLFHRAADEPSTH